MPRPPAQVFFMSGTVREGESSPPRLAVQCFEATPLLPLEALAQTVVCKDESLSRAAASDLEIR